MAKPRMDLSAFVGKLLEEYVLPSTPAFSFCFKLSPWIISVWL